MVLSRPRVSTRRTASSTLPWALAPRHVCSRSRLWELLSSAGPSTSRAMPGWVILMPMDTTGLACKPKTLRRCSGSRLTCDPTRQRVSQRLPVVRPPSKEVTTCTIGVTHPALETTWYVFPPFLPRALVSFFARDFVNHVFVIPTVVDWFRTYVGHPKLPVPLRPYHAHHDPSPQPGRGDRQVQRVRRHVGYAERLHLRRGQHERQDQPIQLAREWCQPHHSHRLRIGGLHQRIQRWCKVCQCCCCISGVDFGVIGVGR